MYHQILFQWTNLTKYMCLNLYTCTISRFLFRKSSSYGQILCQTLAFSNCWQCLPVCWFFFLPQWIVSCLYWNASTDEKQRQVEHCFNVLVQIYAVSRKYFILNQLHFSSHTYALLSRIAHVVLEIPGSVLLVLTAFWWNPI